MQKRHIDRLQYFRELAQTSERYFMPYIKDFLDMAGPISILEVGCGDGGNLLHFAKRGYEVVGVDISANRINDAKSFFEQENANEKFICSDILKLNGYKSYFDLVICHDVIEHIGNKQEMLSRIECFLKPKGLLFIGFPAWQMPFGGHQQICHSKLLSITPFFHMLPQCLYKYILSLGGENVECINELLSIKSTKITIELFEKIVAQTSFDIVDRRLYFVNPHYEVKFGLKPRRLLKPLSEMPYIRNFFSTSCFYILKKSSAMDSASSHTGRSVQ